MEFRLAVSQSYLLVQLSGSTSAIFDINVMQLVAGSEIDSAFGAKLGLSTLAAAGLGNLVSDVAGVSMANRIEV